MRACAQRNFRALGIHALGCHACHRRGDGHRAQARAASCLERRLRCFYEPTRHAHPGASTPCQGARRCALRAHAPAHSRKPMLAGAASPVRLELTGAVWRAVQRRSASASAAVMHLALAHEHDASGAAPAASAHRDPPRRPGGDGTELAPARTVAARAEPTAAAVTGVGAHFGASGADALALGASRRPRRTSLILSATRGGGSALRNGKHIRPSRRGGARVRHGR